MEKSLRINLEDGRLVVNEAAQLQPGDEVRLLITNAEPDESSMKLDLYKLEYQELQEHYRDGYHAVWTNFSYISIAVAAILGLGSRKPDLPASALVCFGGLLYLFWWVATFRPLDDYGEKRADVLQTIEEKVNAIMHENILTHWTVLNEFRRSPNRGFWRVKTVINWIFAPLAGIATLLGGFTLIAANWTQIIGFLRSLRW